VEGSKAGGTGLGLSIAKGFIEAHNGTITAANRQNGGAIFTIKIPTDMPVVDIKG
jgi:two-component system sensor histidine kinase KdpD